MDGTGSNDDPRGKPVTAVPGERPRSPLMMVGPVLVTVEKPRTPKLAAAPRVGATASGAADALKKGLPVAGRSAAKINKNKIVTKRLGLSIVTSFHLKKMVENGLQCRL